LEAFTVEMKGYFTSAVNATLQKLGSSLLSIQ
jgi:hypothetical protein